MNVATPSFNTFDPSSWLYKNLLNPSSEVAMTAREKLFNQVEEVAPPPKNIGDYFDPRKWFDAAPTTPNRLPELTKSFTTNLEKATKNIQTIGDLDIHNLDLPEFTHVLGEGAESVSLKFGKEELKPIINFLQAPLENIDKELLKLTFTPDLVENNPALLSFAAELGLKVKNGAVILDDLNLLQLNDIKVQAEVLKKQPAKLFGKLFDKALKPMRQAFNFITLAKGVEQGEASFDTFQNLKGIVRKVPYIGDWLMDTFDSPHKPSAELGFIDTAFQNKSIIKNAFATEGLKAGAKQTAKTFGTEAFKSIKGAGPLGWVISIAASFGDIKKGYDEGNPFKMVYPILRNVAIGGAATALVSLALPLVLPILPFALPAFGALALTTVATIGAGMITDSVVGKGEQIAGGLIGGFGAGSRNAAGQASSFNPTVASGLQNSSGLTSSASSGTEGLSEAGRKLVESYVV